MRSLLENVQNVSKFYLYLDFCVVAILNCYLNSFIQSCLFDIPKFSQTRVTIFKKTFVAKHMRFFCSDKLVVEFNQTYFQFEQISCRKWLILGWISVADNKISQWCFKYCLNNVQWVLLKNFNDVSSKYQCHDLYNVRKWFSTLI